MSSPFSGRAVINRAVSSQPTVDKNADPNTNLDLASTRDREPISRQFSIVSAFPLSNLPTLGDSPHTWSHVFTRSGPAPHDRSISRNERSVEGWQRPEAPGGAGARLGVSLAGEMGRGPGARTEPASDRDYYLRKGLPAPALLGEGVSEVVQQADRAGCPPSPSRIPPRRRIPTSSDRGKATGPRRCCGTMDAMEGTNTERRSIAVKSRHKSNHAVEISMTDFGIGDSRRGDVDPRRLAESFIPA
jgi:hypothetical protein